MKRKRPYLVLSSIVFALASVACVGSPLNSCDGRDTCPTGMACVYGSCVPSTQEACGAVDVSCATTEICDSGLCVTDPASCPTGHVYQSGQCECVPELTSSDPDACGCPAVACETQDSDVREVCQQGQCVCDSEFHSHNQRRCGCDLINCDDHGARCIDGICECDVNLHLNDPENCGCSGEACPDGEVCLGGICQCPNNQSRCGFTCIGFEETCCAIEPMIGVCPPDHICQFSGEGSVMCQPAGTVPCMADGAYVGYCGPTEQCVITEDTFDCVPAEVKHCYYDEQYVGYCDPAEYCITDSNGKYCGAAGSIPCFTTTGTFSNFCTAGQTCLANGECAIEGSTLCLDMSTVCGNGFGCVLAETGWTCHIDGYPPCYQNGLYSHACQPGWKCADDGCIPADWTLCDEETSCGPAAQCAHIGGPGDWTCYPIDNTLCYDDGYVAWACGSGTYCNYLNDPEDPLIFVDFPWCVPSGWQLCANGESCAPGHACYVACGGDYSCLPSGQVPCLVDGCVDHICGANQSCTENGCGGS